MWGRVRGRGREAKRDRIEGSVLMYAMEDRWWWTPYAHVP